MFERGAQLRTRLGMPDYSSKVGLGLRFQHLRVKPVGGRSDEKYQFREGFYWIDLPDHVSYDISAIRRM
jgi:hypothetical protein